MMKLLKNFIEPRISMGLLRRHPMIHFGNHNRITTERNQFNFMQKSQQYLSGQHRGIKLFSRKKRYKN